MQQHPNWALIYKQIGYVSVTHMEQVNRVEVMNIFLVSVFNHFFRTGAQQNIYKNALPIQQ